METTFEKVECPVCNTMGNWKNVDEFRYKPSGMCLCMTCGFVTYPKTLADTDKLKEFYREDYRDTPTIQNVYAGQRKLHYHGVFLRDLFREWKKAGKKTPAVFEIGAAFGMFLHWVRNNFPEADIRGSELTTSYRRNAWHEYAVWLGEEMDLSIQYDLVASYKVAEHIPKIDRELRKYAEALAPGGHLYISVPIWFKALTNFGASGFSLEYYFHTNHINVWTQKLFETLLAKSGLEIVKTNRTMYDDTYLCRRNDELLTQAPQYEDPAQMLEWLAKIRQAGQAFDEGRFSDAVGIWPNFPEAHVARYESNRVTAHKQGYDAMVANLVTPAIAACPDSVQCRLFGADVAMRYNKWVEAMTLLEQCAEMRPNDPPSLMNLSQCFRQMANAAEDPEQKAGLYAQARDVARLVKATSMQSQGDAINWTFNDNARIPMPTERPMVRVKSTDAPPSQQADLPALSAGG